VVAVPPHTESGIPRPESGIRRPESGIPPGL
jgi:hypothetical protein